MLSDNTTSNAETLSFVDQTLSHYRDIAYGLEPKITNYKTEYSFPSVDLVVILGNAIDGRTWDG